MITLEKQAKIKRVVRKFLYMLEKSSGQIKIESKLRLQMNLIFNKQADLFWRMEAKNKWLDKCYLQAQKDLSKVEKMDMSKNPDNVINFVADMTEEWHDDIKDDVVIGKTLKDSYVNAYDLAGQQALNEFKIKESFKLKNIDVLKSLSERGNFTSDQINQTSWELLQNRIADGFWKEGKDTDKVARDIKDLFEETYKGRSENIARTEIGEVMSDATLESYKEMDIEKKEWGAEVDACELCAPLDGQIVGIDENFDNGDGWTGQRPLVHPSCFINHNVLIFTSKGFKEIGKINIGDLVLSHKGKFRKVLNTFKIGKQKPKVVKLFFELRRGFGDRVNSLTVTEEHPVLINGVWKKAIDCKIGDKLKVLANKCEHCGKLIAYGYRFCNHKCSSTKSANEKWNNNIERKRNASEQMKKQQKEWKRKGLLTQEKAHEKTREMARQGKHPFQLESSKIKSAIANGKHNSYLEKKMKWLLENMKLNFIQQYPIKRNYKNKFNRNRYYFADFCLPDKKIIIECDGEFWHKDILSDKKRQSEIEEKGFTVLRFSGNDIRNNLKVCADELKRVLMNHDNKYEFIDIEIKKIDTWDLKKARTLYNLSVDKDESFLAKGIAVHNCRCFTMAVVPENFIPLSYWTGN